MAPTFALEGSSRAVAFPSVLSPNDSTPSMSISEASVHMRRQLHVQSENHPSPSPCTITVMFYGCEGYFLLNTRDMPKVTLEKRLTLEYFVKELQELLDSNIRDGIIASQSMLLIHLLEFRVAGEQKYPPVSGKEIGDYWGSTHREEEPYLLVTGMLWPGPESEEAQYFDLYQALLLRGVKNPILKVRTVMWNGGGIPAPENRFLREQHHFGQGEYEEEEIRGRTFDRKGKGPEITSPMTNNGGRERNKTEGYTAQFAKTLMRRLPADLDWSAPEFKLLYLYVDALKKDPDAKIEDVYGLHLRAGEEPIQALATKGNVGYSEDGTFVLRDTMWLGHDHPNFPAIVEVTKPETEPEDMMNDSEYHPSAELTHHKLALIKYHEERRQAAIGFEDADDEIYFPMVGKLESAAAAKLTPESEKSIKNPRRAARGQKHSRAEQATATNLKVLTQFQQTVAKPSGTSPVRTFPSLHSTPATSPVTLPSGMQLGSATDMPIIQHGVSGTERAKSPKKLRADSPAFPYNQRTTTFNNTIAVSNLLRLVQRQGVTTARKKNDEIHADIGEDTGAQARSSPLSDVASPSALYSKPSVDQGQAFGVGASHTTPTYYDTQSRPKSQPASGLSRVTISASSSQFHPQSQSNLASPINSGLQYSSRSDFTPPPFQQQIATGIPPRPFRIPVTRQPRTARAPPHLATTPGAAVSNPSRYPSGTVYYPNPQSHNMNNPNATVLSFPSGSPLAHPQPKANAPMFSEKDANAFSNYQSQMDGRSHGSANDNASDAASGRQKEAKVFKFGPQ